MKLVYELKDDEIILFSSFIVSGKLKSEFGELTKILEKTPSFRNIRDSNSIVFEILSGNKQKIKNPIIEFKTGQIKYTFYYERANALLYTVNLKQFLAILAYLSEIYVVDLSTLYGYLIEALQNSYPKPNEIDKIVYSRFYNKISALSDVNLALSHEIKNFFAIDIENKKIIETYTLFCSQVLNNFSHQNNIDARVLAMKLGVDDLLLTKVNQLTNKKV